MKKSNLILIGLAILLIAGFAYLLTPRDPKLSFIDNDIKQDRARFTPWQSIDIAMAMGLTKHAAPKMLNPPEGPPPLLLFPPTEEDLAKLSGP